MGTEEGMVTFLLTDVEGSSRHWEASPDWMRGALAAHDAIMSETITRNGGLVLTTHGEGDSFFSVFRHAGDAVAAACTVQRCLAAQPWTDGRQLRVRMALHSGMAGGDFRGTVANRCARVRACAHGGQVLLSMATVEVLGDELPADVGLLDLGWHVLRDFGPVQLFQLRIPGLPATFPPPESRAPESLSQLPADLVDFTGRRDEVAHVIAVLERAGRGRPAVCVVAGKPGSGKSSLAIHVAHRLKALFPYAQFYASLRGQEEEPRAPATVLAGLVRALGVANKDIPDDADERAALYRSMLAGRRVLLVLDGARDEGQVRPLLPGSPTCAVVITSRIRLTALEGAEIVDLEDMDRADAVELLGRIVGDGRVAHERAAAEEVVELCGRLPLGVRIAGANLGRRRHWSMARLARRLSDERRRLDELRAGDLDVRASFALGYQQCREPERLAFRRLVLLTGPDFSPGAVAAVIETDPDEAEDLLERLHEGHLVETPADGRYRLHDLIRVFALERLSNEEPVAEQRAAVQRLLRWYLSMAQDAAALLRPHDSIVSTS